METNCSPVAARPSAIDGWGLFATRNIPRGAQVVEYVGVRITKEESARRCERENPYIFALDEAHDLDGSTTENVARFANHSCAPNCEAVRVGDRIWLRALRDISEGEEITFNYGYDLEDYRDHPCRCGAPGCVGYIVAEEFFPTLRLRGHGGGAPPAGAG